MKSVYGPVASWRLGKSLGVDLICSECKICSFDCVYCQLERTEEITNQRREFVSIQRVNKEVEDALAITSPDVITFSGTGEPTLATNLDEAIDALRKITDIPLAILTNSSLMDHKDVQQTLAKLDIIVAKLDASNPELFKVVNQPAPGVEFESVIRGMKELRSNFSGTFALQIMFIEANKAYASDIATLSREINPDEVQINTPLRPCEVAPLSKEELMTIEKEFKGLNTINVYTSTRPKTDPLDKMELFKRRRLEP